MNDASDAVAARATELLAGILERMGITDSDIAVAEDEHRITLAVDCEDPERLVGRRGQVLDALQHVLGKMVYRGRVRGEGPRTKPIVVDAAGYRAKHVERLEGLAARMAEKAIRDQSTVAMNPMPAFDRRIMHMKLAETPGVSTRSEGEGDERHLLIIPDPDAGVAQSDATSGE
jgi:spoIIIJ-associated protein